MTILSVYNLAFSLNVTNIDELITSDKVPLKERTRAAEFVKDTDLKAKSLIDKTPDGFNVQAYFQSFLKTFENYENVYKAEKGKGMLDDQTKADNLELKG